MSDRSIYIVKVFVVILMVVAIIMGIIGSIITGAQFAFAIYVGCVPCFIFMLGTFIRGPSNRYY